MSISNLFLPNPYTIYAKNFIPSEPPGTPGKVAFFDGAGAIDSANITVTGANNDLTFDNNTTIFVDNIQSTDGDLNLGGGVTNLLTMNSLNQTTIDAANNIRIGHPGLLINMFDNLNVPTVTTTDIESLTNLSIGSATTNVMLDALNTLAIGATTPNLVLDATSTLNIGHVGGTTGIHDSVQVVNINSATANLNIGIGTNTTGIGATNQLILGVSTPTTDIEAITNLIIGSTTPTIHLGNSFISSQIIVPNAATLEIANIDHAVSASLYPSTPFVGMGGVGGTVQFNGGVSFVASGAAKINRYYEALFFAVTASGPFASQAIGNLSLQRTNNICTLVLKWVGPAVTVTATTPLTLDVALAVEYRPGTPQAAACAVFVSGTYAQMALVGVDASGIVSVAPAGGLWTIGLASSFDTINLVYSMGI